MKFSQGQLGRVFVVRLEDGDRLPETLEQFAAAQNIAVAQVILVGGIGSGEVVVGPRHSDRMPPDPMTVPLDGAHEVAAVGVIAPTGAERKPVLHIHGAMGRSGKTTAGCLREGVNTWMVGEAIVIEVTGTAAARVLDDATGFTLLEPGGEA